MKEVVKAREEAFEQIGRKAAEYFGELGSHTLWSVGTYGDLDTLIFKVQQAERDRISVALGAKDAGPGEYIEISVEEFREVIDDTDGVR